MKAISLPQPWASLVALGEKHFHAVRWETDYRGPIAIHALDDKSWENSEKARERVFADLLAKHGLTFEMLPFGLVIATATLHAVHHSAFIARQLSRQERKLNSPHYTHQHTLEFRNVQPFPGALPTPGGAQVWEWDWEAEPITGATEELPAVEIAAESAPRRKKS